MPTALDHTRGTSESSLSPGSLRSRGPLRLHGNSTLVRFTDKVVPSWQNLCSVMPVVPVITISLAREGISRIYPAICIRSRRGG